MTDFENRTYMGQRWSDQNSRLYHCWRYEDREDQPEAWYKELAPKFASLGTTFRFTLSEGNKFYISGPNGPVRVGRIEDEELLNNWSIEDRAAKTRAYWMSMSRKEGDQFKELMAPFRAKYWSFSDRRLRTAYLASIIYEITLG